MNMVLLTLGLFIIIISIILITISFNVKDESSNNTAFQTLVKENIKKEHQSSSENEGKTNEINNQNIKNMHKNINAMDDNKMTVSEIILMHKNGVPINDIAKRFNKGVREVETILKVSRINKK